MSKLQKFLKFYELVKDFLLELYINFTLISPFIYKVLLLVVLQVKNRNIHKLVVEIVIEMYTFEYGQSELSLATEHQTSII